MAIVRRALLSCHDKTGLEAFAKGLASLGVELVASKGTAAFLQQQGLSAKTVEEFAGITEQLDGRVKTLHPRIHAGILARRDDPAHVKAVGPDGLLDLVIVNLYPFEEVSRRAGVTLLEALEQVDIGGVALLRAAAKNFPSVTVICSPRQYPEVLAALREGRGSLPEDLRRRLAVEAFHATSRYDHWIAEFVAGEPTGTLPDQLTLAVRKHHALRYGENPHQQGAWYVPLAGAPAGLAALQQLHGKELSYNNLVDVETAVRCLRDFSDPTCVIVKHASPCGLASAEAMDEAYSRALAGDEESAFGGIVGLNRPLDAKTAAAMAGTFLEVIVAPAMEAAAVEAFAKKPNVRLVTLTPAAPAASLEWRSVLGGWLVQETDHSVTQPSTARVVTRQQPTAAQQRDLQFAWTAAAHVRSNAIVLARDRATVGIGQGQPSRVRAVQLALQNAGPRCHGAVLASDGFFPFPDSVERAAKAGVRAIIQPGGSVKDRDVIAAADTAGLAMVFTGVRHFRH